MIRHSELSYIGYILVHMYNYTVTSLFVMRIQILITTLSIQGTEAEFNYYCRGCQIQTSLPLPVLVELTSEGTSGHQNLVSIFPGINNCLEAK